MCCGCVGGRYEDMIHKQRFMMIVPTIIFTIGFFAWVMMFGTEQYLSTCLIHSPIVFILTLFLGLSVISELQRSEAIYREVMETICNYEIRDDQFERSLRAYKRKYQSILSIN